MNNRRVKSVQEEKEDKGKAGEDKNKRGDLISKREVKEARIKKN